MKNLYNFILLSILVSFSACTESVPEFTNDWDEDVYYFGKNLEKEHADLFFNISKSEFDKDILTLRNETNNLEDQKIINELLKITSKIGDSHTQLEFRSRFSPLPFGIGWFDDGIFFTEIDANNLAHLGKEIISVNGTPILEVIDAFRSLITYENESNFKNQVVNYLTYIEFYNELGFNNSSSKITFKLDDGNEYIAEKITIETFKLFHSETPIFLKNRGKFYWFEELTDHDLIYIQYNSCHEQSTFSFQAFTNQIKEAISNNIDISKLVIDMRHNGGGNSSIMKPLINELENYIKNDRFTKDDIYLIVGRNTFSSALLNSIEIKEKIDNVVLGEPTGGKPNHFGEVKSFNLPNSKLQVYYSTKYFELNDDNEDSFIPDITVEYNFTHFNVGVDPVLEMIKNF